MKQIVVFPRGQISELDKARMDEAGIVAVEADNPDDVVLLMPSTGHVNADDMLMSALWELSSRGEGDRMIKELHRRLSAKEKGQP
jgi:hypothetical protein